MAHRWYWLAGLLLVSLVGCGGRPKAPIGPLTGSVQGRLATGGTRQAQGFGHFIAKVHGTDFPTALTTLVRDDDGFFRIDGVPAGEQVITVEDRQRMKGAVFVCFVRPGQVTDVGEVEPRQLGMISGIVSEADENGNLVKPVARASVIARPIENFEDTLEELPGRPFFVAFTKEAGNYELLVPEGTYLVEARHPNYEPATDTVSVSKLQGVSLNFGLFPLRDRGTVFGTVTAVVNGQTVPVPGALVALMSKDITPLPGVTKPPPSPKQLTVGQIVSTMKNPVRGVKGRPEIGNGNHHGVGHSNSGNANSGHVGGMRPFPRPLFTFTKADGSYELTGVPAGDYTTIAFKRGYGYSEKKGIIVKANEKVRVDFVLPTEFGTVQGKVNDAETGKPIEGAIVFATRWGDPWFGWDEWEADKYRPGHWIRPMPAIARRPVRPNGQGHSRPGGQNRPNGQGIGGQPGVIRPMPPLMPPFEPPVRAGTVTDKNGNYQILLPAGDYFINVVKEGYEWQGVEVQVQAGQAVTVDFALTKFLPPTDLSGLSLELEVKPQVPIGEKVTMTLKVRNVSDRPITLELGLPEADFVVMTEDGEEVWCWSHDKAFILIVVLLTLQPGEEKGYSVEWEQVDNDGNPVSAGTYLVQGIFAQMIETEPKPLVILP